jgi:hypothetical protein
MAKSSLDDCPSLVNQRTKTSAIKADIEALDLEDVISEHLAKARALMTVATQESFWDCSATVGYHYLDTLSNLLDVVSSKFDSLVQRRRAERLRLG